MGTPYIKEFKVSGKSYGIEDYEDGKPLSDHFFGPDYGTKRKERYQLWAGGCGIGRATNLQDAELKLSNYIKGEILENIDKNKNSLEFWNDQWKVFSKYGIGKFWCLTNPPECFKAIIIS